MHAKAEKDLEKEIAQVKVKCPYGCDNIITILDILVIYSRYFDILVWTRS